MADELKLSAVTATAAVHVKRIHRDRIHQLHGLWRVVEILAIGAHLVAGVTLWDAPDLRHLRPVWLVRHHVGRCLLWAEVPIGLHVGQVGGILFGVDNLWRQDLLGDVIHQ